MIAPSKAKSTVGIVTVLMSTIPLPIVVATAVPASAPSRFQKAAHKMAALGVSTRVDTTVAMAFAVS